MELSFTPPPPPPPPALSQGFRGRPADGPCPAGIGTGTGTSGCGRRFTGSAESPRFRQQSDNPPDRSGPKNSRQGLDRLGPAPGDRGPPRSCGLDDDLRRGLWL